jgi:amino acid transporter
MSLRTTASDPLETLTSHPAEIPLPSESYVRKALPSILTTWDMTALFILILYFITNDSNAIAGGAAGLSLWVVGGLLFFIPCGIATAQLGVLFPHEGSLYSWTHKTFGGYMSFFVAFAAWVPGSLLLLATSDLIVSIIQGLNPKWLADPRSQGGALLVILVSTCIIALQRHRTVQNMINVAIVAILLATALVCISGLVWLLGGHHPATNFMPLTAWNPFTATNYPLFGVITLGYLGVNLPLNLGGELRAPDGGTEHKIIMRHVFWGIAIVLACYLLSTFGILVVQGQSASFILFAPVSTVDMALGKTFGDITAICIMLTLVLATAVYNYIFARFLLAGSIDARIPRAWGKLNRNRIPSNAIVLQTVLSCILVILFFIVIPYTGLLSGPPAHLAAVFYFVSAGAATLLWAFATIFLFVNILWLLIRHRQLFHHRQIFPTWVLSSSAVVGLIVGLAAIADTILNSYDPPDIANGTWWFVVTGLTGVFLVIGAIAGMFASGEASWQELEGLERS